MARRGSIPAATAHQRGRVAGSLQKIFRPCAVRHVTLHTCVHIANVLAAKQQGMALDDLQAARQYVAVQPLDGVEVYKALPCQERPRRFEEVISPPRVAIREAVCSTQERA